MKIGIGLLSGFVSMGLVAGCATGDHANGVYEAQADREGIREILRQRIPELQICYENAIDEMPGAEGKMTLEWDLITDGSVQNLRVKTADKKIEGAVPCVLQKVGTWKFPKPADDEVMAVTYPFCFSENGKICLSKEPAK